MVAGRTLKLVSIRISGTELVLSSDYYRVWNASAVWLGNLMCCGLTSRWVVPSSEIASVGARSITHSCF